MELIQLCPIILGTKPKFQHFSIPKIQKLVPVMPGQENDNMEAPALSRKSWQSECS